MTDQRDARAIKPGKTYASPEEVQTYRKLLEMTKRSPIPNNEILANLGLFHVRGSFARMLFMHTLYLKALNTHGVMVEFGVRWGQNMVSALLQIRQVHQPVEKMMAQNRLLLQLYLA